ncbi:MAG: DUF4388 domain-containing protein [Acidimicrobiales bacterium]
MSLQGTLETIPLPDVLALLAATKKTGELRITGGKGDGRLWLDAGKVVGADVPRAATPVDAVFELLRLTAGSFTFGGGAPPNGPGAPLAIDALLVEAQERLSAWQAIEAVVPSMACTLRLIPELGPDSVTVTRQQWKQMVAVVAGGDVTGAMKHLAIGEFDACRTVKDLVDAGLVQVGKAPAPPAPAPETARPASAPPPAASGKGADSADAPMPGPVRRPAPTAGPVTPPQAPPRPAPRPAPVPGRAPAAAPGPANAAPAAVANGGRSAAPPRGPEPTANREEAEELVQHLATLGKAHAKAAPARGGPAAKGEDSADDQPVAPEGDHEGEGSVEGNGDEPINRGMLLKFLSSVRP